MPGDDAFRALSSVRMPSIVPPNGEGRIPFNKPFIVGKELYYISQAVIGGQLAGDGRFSQLCCRWMEETYQAKKVLLTHSCTAALEMCAILCDIGPGDEVILPSYTFVSTANAFALRGATLRFVDIRPDTLNLDENKLEDAITPRTRAIVPVHYGGVGAEMDSIMEIARRHGLRVIEDAAQGVNATYKRKPLGTIGDLGTYSFHETKNFIAGEGGALLVNDEELIERAQFLRDKGTNRVQFKEGKVDKYTWVDHGSSYLPSELVAAFLYAQLEAADQITRQRRAIFSYYARAFAPLAQRELVRTPDCPTYCQHNAHMFCLLLPTRKMRDDLIKHLAERNIQGVFHYIPLHNSPMAEQLGVPEVDLPVTDDIAGRLLRLPCYFSLERADQDRVIDAVESFV